MFRRVFILLLFVTVYVDMYAQVGEQRHNLSIGINGGALYNSLSFVPKVEQNPYIGYNLGGTVRYICEKYMGLLCGVQLELNYVEKGWKENNEYIRDMHYIDIPFLAHISYGKKNVKGILNIGPEFSILLSENEKISGLYTSNRLAKFADKKLDYGIVGGLGMDVSSKVGSFILEARYYYGLSDIYNNSKSDYYSRSAHTTITLKLTYLFDILK